MSNYKKAIVDLLKVKYDSTGLAGVNGFLKSNKIKNEYQIVSFSTEKWLKHTTARHPYMDLAEWMEKCPEDEFRCEYHETYSRGYTLYRGKRIKILE